MFFRFVVGFKICWHWFYLVIHLNMFKYLAVMVKIKINKNIFSYRLKDF